MPVPLALNLSPKTEQNDRDITSYYHYKTQTESKPVSVQFVRDSKRFVPEAVNVVAGLLDRFASANGVAASASLCAQSIPTLAHMPDHVLLLNRAAAAKKRGARDDAKVSLWAAWGLEGVRLDPPPHTHTPHKKNNPRPGCFGQLLSRQCLCSVRRSWAR
jgi:hypothetical protein